MICWRHVLCSLVRSFDDEAGRPAFLYRREMPCSSLHTVSALVVIRISIRAIFLVFVAKQLRSYYIGSLVPLHVPGECLRAGVDCCKRRDGGQHTLPKDEQIET